MSTVWSDGMVTNDQEPSWNPEREISFNALEKYTVFGHNRLYNYGKDNSSMANK